MNWYEKIQALSLEQVLSDCGHELIKKRFRNCPACGASRTSKDRRPPVGVFGNGMKRRWHCNACHAEGGKFDIISYYLHNVPVSGLADFKQLRSFVDATKTDYEPTKKIEVIAPPEYPPIEEVEKALKRGVKFLRDVNISPKLSEFLKSRRLDQNRIPCGLANPYAGVWDDLTKVKTSNGRNSYWFPRQWTREYGLIFPLVDHLGNIRSFLGRTWYSRSRKTTVPISYTTQGLLLANHDARQWMREKNFVKEVIICEGEIDYATACQDWQGIVIGIRSGSIDVCKKLPWTQGTTVYICTDNDEKGDQYADKIAKLVGNANPMRVRFGHDE